MNGVLIVDKPSGITSHDVVDIIRRRFHIKKVGHAGTLDPLATGVLVILVGRATKLSNILMNRDKEYEVVMALGKRTDTGDADGKVIYESGDCKNITLAALNEVLERFRGQIPQIPPMMSAIKHKGKKLYELARKGIEIERQPRQVNIKELRVLSFNPPDATLRIKCTKGTYVRVLCDDIGLALGCGAYVSRIRRVASGEFSVNEAVSVDMLRQVDIHRLGQMLKNENYYKFKTFK
ncbi:MAG: tRNA pseudouridine(55) synthase TruB [Candidatus Omnitrophica bacterium]|nr:tRNA pseudouridine(55) synthase TruB [Candidatus Omnitrophota bacterium]